MFIFRHGGRRAPAKPALPTRRVRVHAGSKRTYAARIDIPAAPPPFPVIETCPSPTCQCAEVPAGLDIEREQNLNGSMATYAEHVLICTGRSDWKSRIEEEEGEHGEGVLVRQLKALLGPRGKYSDPYHNTLMTNCSFPPTPSPPHHKEKPSTPSLMNGSVRTAEARQSNDQQPAPPTPSASAFLLPSFQYLPTIPTDPASVENLVRAFILPSQLHQSHDRLTRDQKNILLRQPELQRRFIGARKIDEILVLICGHGGRDARCGTLGPILKSEFEDKLHRQNIPILHDTPVAEAQLLNTEVDGYTPTARVGLISHIGGHKWAGNVIVYIPSSFSANALRGKGIWYGRVAPANVEGIVTKTILEGKVIKEMFRGGIDQSGEILRL